MSDHAAIEALARSASPRSDTWEDEPESFKDWWRDEARFHLHLEGVIAARLGPAMDRFLNSDDAA